MRRSRCFASRVRIGEEFLQVLQYLVIAPDINSPICNTTINRVLTLAGFLHICMQPYF